MNRIFKSSTLLSGNRHDPLKEHKRKTLDALLWMFGVSAAITIGFMLLARFSGPNFISSQDQRFFLTSGIFFLLAILVVALVERTLSFEAASIIFNLLFFVGVFFSDSLPELFDGRSIIMLILPVVTASVLLRPWAGLAIAAGFGLIMTGFHVYYHLGLPNIPAILVLMLVAFVVEQATSNLERVVGLLEQTKRTLQANEERFRALIESTTDVNAILGHDGTIQYVSPSVERMLGYKAEDFIGRNISSYLHPEDVDIASAALGSTIPAEAIGPLLVLRLLHANGSWITVEVIGNEMYSHPAIQGTVVNCRDITERKQVENQLRESNQLLESTFACLEDAVFVIDAKTTKITDCNPAATTMFGYNRPSLLGKTTDLLHVDDSMLEEFRRELNLSMQKNGSLSHFEFRMKRRNGTIFPTEHSVTTLVDQQGDQIGWVSVVHDITERKHAEAKLRESEEIFATAFQLSPMPMAISGSDGEYIEINQAFTHTLGYQYEELVGRTPTEVNIFVDAEQNRNAIQILRGGGKLRGYEMAVKSHSGEILNGVFFAEPMKLHDHPMVLTLMYDITARKHMEDELRESEEKYHRLIETLPIGVIVHEDGLIQLINRTGARILGVENPEELIGKPILNFVHPDYREIVQERIQASEALGGQAGLPYEKMVRLDGTSLDVEVVVMPINIEGKTSRLLMFADITERKQAEAGLRKSEENFRNLSENTADGILIATPEGRHVYANWRACQILGYTQEELIQTTIEDIADPAAIPMVMNTLKDRIAGRPVPATYETVVRRKNGTSLPVEIRGTRTIWQDQPCDLVLIRDITERKESEEAIKKSEENFRSLSENSSDGIVIVSRDGKHQYANPHACELLQYSLDEILQKYLVDVIAPEFFPLIKKRLQERLAGKQLPKMYETILIRKDGSLFPVEISGTRTIWQDEVCDLAIFHDITERKQAQEAIKSQNLRIQEVSRQLVDVQEREKRMLASELHDDLGQSLTSLKLMLELASSSHTRSKRHEVMGDSLDLVTELMGKVRNISLDLRPAMLDDFGLLAALRWLFERFHAQAGIVVHCNNDLAGDQRFSPDIETAAFRITQEALTNVARHAEVKEVQVNLEIGECLTIEIADQGTGFATLQEALDPTSSVGLTGMQERARLLGGLLEIHSELGVGTHIIATIPLTGDVQ